MFEVMGCRKNIQGQVAILFALVATFMFVLLAMVIDFGHLVNTKINLQIAADTAAYSGAAWQSNLMNRISMINYRMRQDIKELAYRVHVVHIRHNKNFPHEGEGGISYVDQPDQLTQVEDFVCQQAHDYVSLSGRVYDPDTNLCKNASPSSGGLPPIIVPPVIAGFDPYSVALQAQIRKIADAANEECSAAAADNVRLVTRFNEEYLKRSRDHFQQINDLVEYMNSVGGGTLSDSEANPVRKVMFQSAFNNLALANRDQFKLQILTPQGNRYIGVEPITLDNANLFYVDFTLQGDGCIGNPKGLAFPAGGLIAGITKTPEVVTYMAVKASSTPQMLFMPQRWVEAVFPRLEAYAAAKPFGSRLGPAADSDPLLPTGKAAGTSDTTINFSFIPNDKFGILSTKRMALLDSMLPLNSVGLPDGNQNTGWPDEGKGKDLNASLNLIKAPTVFDALFYSIFPNPNQPNQYEEPAYAELLYPDYLEVGGPDNVIIQNRQPATAPYFQFTPSGNRGQGWIKVNLGATGGNALAYQNYANESIGTHSVLAAEEFTPVTNGNAQEFGFAPFQMLHSGWAPPGQPGRIGYSTKFVGFEALNGSLFVITSSGAQGQIANPPSGDEDVKQVIH